MCPIHFVDVASDRLIIVLLLNCIQYKNKFYFLGTFCQKSPCEHARTVAVAAAFSCLPSWVVGDVRKPKILFSFSINRHRNTHGLW